MMVTTVALILVQLQVSAIVNDNNMWMDDYGAALRQTSAEGMPLLVILERPADMIPTGANQDRSRGPVELELLQNYKLCRIDVRTKYGQAVADAFGVDQFPHTVIIDKTARKQVFIRTGELTKEQWIAALASHKDAEYIEPEIYNSSSAKSQGRSGAVCRT